jgi:hypothetical protein
MEFPYVAKLGGSLLSALAAWWGYRKFRGLLSAYRELLGARDAQPFVNLKYRWSGDLASPKHHVLILHLGNREKRPLIIHELRWLVPPFRLSWDADPLGHNVMSRIEEGEGIEIEFDPLALLTSVSGTRLFKGWLRRIVVVCELRLALYLQTGEIVAKRVPGSMRCFLAFQQGFSGLSRRLIRLHAYVWP